MKQIGRDTQIFQNLIFKCCFIALLRRFYCEFRTWLGAFAIRPIFFEANALFGNDLIPSLRYAPLSDITVSIATRSL